MAQKKRIIEFKDVDTTSFGVWTDLSDSELTTIEGVVSIGPVRLDGCRHIYFDPRYDIEDIKCELTALAAQQNDEALASFTVHPRESWPGPCGTTETPND